MLILRNVKVDYYGMEVIRFNFEFNHGITMLLGEVGSFKTTLFRVLGGIKEIGEGEIILDGVNIEETPPKNRKMAFVGRDSMPTKGTVLKGLMLPLRLRKISKREAKFKASEAAKKFGLTPKSKIKELSKSELISFFKTRLSLREAKVTMFDEPYHFFGEEYADLITDMIAGQKGYVLVSSCDGGDVERLKPDYLVVLNKDKVLLKGKTVDVIAADDKYISKFIG